MPEHKSKFADIFPDELKALGIDAADDARPSTSRGLAGIALSGGGIRSAAFNLGILTGLHKRGILSHIDYLSTVSGGGYIGSCLSCMFQQNTVSELLGPAPGNDLVEGRMLTHLRNHSSYMVTRGFWDWARIAGRLLSGIFVNFTLLLPLVLVATTGAALFTIIDVGSHFPVPFFLSIITLGAWILLTCLSPWLLQGAGPGLRNSIELTSGGLLFAVPAIGLLEAQPYLLRWLHSLDSNGAHHTVTAALGIVSAIAGALSGDSLSKLKNNMAIVGEVVALLMGLLLPFCMYLVAAEFAAFAREWFPGPAWVLSAIYLGAAALLYLVFSYMDVNITSMHGLYRDRLTEAFLRNLKHERPAHDTKLSEIVQRPYHLINVTMNLQDSKDRSLRQRNGDFFVLSPCYVGSERTGYVPTSAMEKQTPDLGLGSAVAISGAAASPNMGTFTSQSLVLIMGLLNVRLGYWLANPARMRRKNPGVGWFYRELLSKLDDQGDFVNISDGGHLENTGAYELLRRRCRFIIIGDGGADPDYGFNDLASLMRYARIDLGVEINIELDGIRPGDGVSSHPSALGIIRYPELDGLPEELGFLLYIKSSITGNEDEVVQNYRVSHPPFPHESTADQFFDEAQFEAYRALGEGIVGKLIGHGRGRLDRDGRMNEDNFQALFMDLAVHLAPDPKLDKIKTRNPEKLLAQIGRELQRPEMLSYFLELYPETPLLERPKAEPAHLAMLQPVVDLQLSVMETVLVAESLDTLNAMRSEAQRGWLNLFSRWARSNVFRRAWLHLIPARSARLQIFGRTFLDLQDFLSWREHDANDTRPGPDGIPLGYVPPELLPEETELAARPGVRCLRLAYSIKLESGGAPFAAPLSRAGFHTTIIGYALLDNSELFWMKLRPGYQGVYFYQRAIASLRAIKPELTVEETVIPKKHRGRVSTDLCFFEDAGAEELRTAHAAWELGEDLLDSLSKSLALEPTSFVPNVTATAGYE